MNRNVDGQKRAIILPLWLMLLITVMSGGLQRKDDKVTPPKTDPKSPDDKGTPPKTDPKSPDDKGTPPKTDPKSPDDKGTPPKTDLKSPDDDSTPPKNDTTPPDDVGTSTKRDTTPPEDDGTSAKNDTTAPDDDGTSPKNDTTAPDDDGTSPKNDTTPPDDDGTSPKNDTTPLGDDVTTPTTDTTPTDDNVTTPTTDTTPTDEEEFSLMPPNVTISFCLYSKDNSDPDITYFDDNRKLHFKYFQPTRKTVVLIHGHTNQTKESAAIFFMELFPKFLSIGDFNVIMVDWTKLAQDLDFLVFVANTDFAGREVAEMIWTLRNSSEIEPFHVIGVDIGCVVSAIASYKIRGKNIERITALDPPHLIMFHIPSWSRLSRTSADLVEAIHSSGRYNGSLEPVAHRDFYINGGTWPQPGCDEDTAGHCSIFTSVMAYGLAMESQIKATYCEGYENFVIKLCTKKEKINLYNNATKKEFPQGKYYLNFTQTTNT